MTARQVCARNVAVDATPMACELSEPDSVRACVGRVRDLGQPLDVVICNAGIMALPKLEQSHGYALQFFTNHIGQFILLTGLLSTSRTRLEQGGKPSSAIFFHLLTCDA